MMALYASSAQSESPLAALLNEPSLQTHRLTLAAKAVLYQPDDPAANLFYIHSGQVRTYQIGACGSRRMVEILGPDTWCGGTALAGMKTYRERAETVAPTTVSIIPAARLFAALPHEPALAIDLIRQLATKLAHSGEDASGLVFEDCDDRLVRILLALSSSPAATPAEDGVVIRITHQQLAQKVGVARETVSLALAQLRRNDLLRTGRNQLSFSPQRLREWTLRKPS